MASGIKTYLVRGAETSDGFNILFRRSGIISKNMEYALRSYLVNGVDSSSSIALGEVPKSNFSRDLKKMNKTASDFYEYFEMNHSK